MGVNVQMVCEMLNIPQGTVSSLHANYSFRGNYPQNGGFAF